MQDVFLGLGDADGAQLQVDGAAQVGNLRREAEHGGEGCSERGGQAPPQKSEGGTFPPWSPRLSGERPHCLSQGM